MIWYHYIIQCNHLIYRKVVHSRRMQPSIQMSNVQNHGIYLFDGISALDMSKTNWRVQVRVTRMWPSTNNGVLIAQNLILLDKTVCNI